MVSTPDLEVPVPIARESEMAVLGQILQSEPALEYALKRLSAVDFFDPAHERIWLAAQTLADGGRAVNALSVMTELRDAGELGRIGGAEYLHTLVANPWQYADVAYPTIQVRQASIQRRVLRAHQRQAQVLVQHAGDHDTLMAAMAREQLSMAMLIEERDDLSPVEGLDTWDDFLDRPHEGTRWIIPRVLMAQDVMILLAGEGGGKSWFNRQFCMSISAGLHPFHPERPIAPRNTLLIDLENPANLVAEEATGLRNQVRRLGQWGQSQAYIWHRPRGLNLRERSGAQLLERVIAETNPEVVGLGSLYKAMHKGNDPWEQAAEEVREVFDRLRERYGCAFVLEHHMPKGDGDPLNRPGTPLGSQQWMGWASLGYVIRRVGDNMWAFEQFRGNRGDRELPVGLIRGGDLPWSAVWDMEELEYGKWDELRNKTTRGTRR